jgi:hypothetical protein
LKALVYLFALAFWAVAMLLTYNLVGMVFRGHIEERGATLLALMFGLAVLYGLLSCSLIKFGVPKALSLFRKISPGDSAEQASNPLMSKDATSMAKNETPSFIFSQPVTINASTNNNAPGGIISNAPVTVNQYYDKPNPNVSDIDAETIEADPVVPEAETVTLDYLVARTETLMGRAVAENTVRNALERAAVESCGEEKRGRAWAKLFPKEQGEKAIADYVATSKRK